jgi:hypothetical protein
MLCFVKADAKYTSSSTSLICCIPDGAPAHVHHTGMPAFVPPTYVADLQEEMSLL